MYRPQSAYPIPPAPCDDQRCVYSFDSTNLPTFLRTMGPGASAGRIPLRLDKDADFYLRGLSSTGLIAYRLEDTNGNQLSDWLNVRESTNYELPQEFSDTAGFGIAPLESGAGGVFGPAGGNFLLYLFNPTVASINLVTCVLNLHGVKRYSREVCKQ